MTIEAFPPVSSADKNGLVAVGGELNIASLRLAYGQGIFPLPLSASLPVTWFSPDPRGVIDFADLHIPKKLRKFTKQGPFELRCNFDFPQVIRNCAKVKRKHQEDHTETWITAPLEQAYIDLFHAGQAYSVEAWLEERQVGGVYGVCIDGILSAESMYFLESGAGKVCLLYLIKLFWSAGIDWIDTQTTSAVVASLGGKGIPREQFLNRLKRRKPISLEQVFSC